MTFIGTARNVMCGRVLAAAVSSAVPPGDRADGDVPSDPVLHSRPPQAAIDPRVTVIIPTHNGESFIAEAIESVLSQHGVAIEVIVVDDCSTDRTPAIAGAYPSVRVVTMPRRGGNAYVSANVGLSLARTEYVAFLHQDDLWRPGKLARQVALMDGDPGIGLSYSALTFIDPDGRSLARLSSPRGHGSPVVDGDLELRHLCIQNYINVSNAVLRRRALEEVGGFTEGLWFAGEWATWLRIALGWRVAYIDEALCSFRVHPHSQTQSRTADVPALAAQLDAVLDGFFADPGLPAAVRGRERLARANVQLSTVLLAMYWSDRAAAVTALRRLMRLVRPWELPALVHASGVIPRSRARLRASLRGHGRGRIAVVARHGSAAPTTQRSAR